MRQTWRGSSVPARLWALLAAVVILAATTPGHREAHQGWLPDRRGSHAEGHRCGAGCRRRGGPIITVGETIGDDGYRFEAIPDGISFIKNGKGTVDLYLNHETSRVPFPLAANGSGYLPTTNANGSQNDFDNSQLELVAASTAEQGRSGRRIRHSQERPVSALLLQLPGRAGTRIQPTAAVHQLRRASTGSMPRTRLSSHSRAPLALRQIGAVVAFDPASSEYRTIWGMGRLNHENSVGLPGYGHPVVLTTDDTFTTTPSQSQLYSYIADDADAVWDDEGDLWAFVSDNAAFDQLRGLPPGRVGSGRRLRLGHFIQVPKEIATGKLDDGSEISSATVPADLGGPFPAPPGPGFAASSWQTFNNVQIDGPQWVLEWWSKTHNVFEFVRLEDLAYDKRPGMGNVVYLVDSGRGTGSATPPLPTGQRDLHQWPRLEDGPRSGGSDHRHSLSILIEGDDRPARDPDRIHQPDNIESTSNGLYITEDPGSQQQFPFGSIDPTSPNFNPAATNARIWQYKLAGPGAGSYTPGRRH